MKIKSPTEPLKGTRCSCGVLWTEHPGIISTCLDLCRKRAALEQIAKRKSDDARWMRETARRALEEKR